MQTWSTLRPPATGGMALVAPGMGDVPENDQRRAAPDLLHAQRRVGIAGLAAEHVGVPASWRLVEVVDEKDDVVDADQGEGRPARNAHVRWFPPMPSDEAPAAPLVR